jgi:hypothetical protein
VTSLGFLKQFGLRSLADLPPLADLAVDGSERVFELFRGASHGEQPGTLKSNEPV